MINLNDLLKHEILDLYSAEEQIIDALPAMIEKAKNPKLKKALQEHLKITEDQKSRLDKVKQTFGEGDGQNGENKGFFSRLFGSGSGGGEKCRGMEGLITEGEKIMKADITDEALDAAIIANAQKIEHYEICGYGTARAFARELKLAEVEHLLTQTLNEEYAADDRLTSLAVGKLNIEAEQVSGMGENGSNGSYKSPLTIRKFRSTNGKPSSSKGATKTSAGSNGSSSKAAGKSAGNGTSKSSSSKSSAKNSSKGASSKGANKSTGGSSSKGASSKSSASKKGSSKAASKSSSKSSSSKKASNGGGKGSSMMKHATSGQRQR